MSETENKVVKKLKADKSVIATGGSVVYGAKAMELAMDGKFGVLTVIKNGKNIFITGGAGVGKSTLLKKLAIRLMNSLLFEFTFRMALSL